MKQILIVLIFMFVVFNINAQTADLTSKQYIHIEKTLDCEEQKMYNILTDECKKVKRRFITKDNQNCPMYIDEHNFLFYICRNEDGSITSVTLELL